MMHGLRLLNGTEPILLSDKDNRCVRVRFVLILNSLTRPP